MWNTLFFIRADAIEVAAREDESRLWVVIWVVAVASKYIFSLFAPAMRACL